MVRGYELRKEALTLNGEAQIIKKELEFDKEDNDGIQVRYKDFQEGKNRDVGQFQKLAEEVKELRSRSRQNQLKVIETENKAQLVAITDSDLNTIVWIGLIGIITGVALSIAGFVLHKRVQKYQDIILKRDAMEQTQQGE